ncbi:MAG: hydrogenase maturation nickel metallochaperone HypA [Sedimentisphaerales bacterium]|nr:hydrogenase maturation nickel metallochaperone HypA [Sedimentisphaerales bacterium]
MHETMVAKGLLDSIIAESEKRNAKPTKAKMSCGTFNTVNDEVLLFAFEAIAKGTICEGMKLDIEHKSIQGKCKSCGKQFDFNITKPACSHCGCDKFDLLPDPALLLEEIELETD